jgi:quercetin dioxygenase-like cupin family protein
MTDTAAIATPAALAELVSYQAGSVVSRTLLKNAGGSLTLFAFGEGQGLSEHTTPHEAAILVLDGSAQVTIADRTESVPAGAMIHLPASVPHALQAEVPFKMLLTMLREPTG